MKTALDCTILAVAACSSLNENKTDKKGNALQKVLKPAGRFCILPI